MPHPGVGFRGRGKNFNENVEVIVEVEVLCFSTFPQLFLLQKEKSRFRMCHCKKRKTVQSLFGMRCHRRFTQQPTPPEEGSLKHKPDLPCPGLFENFKASCCLRPRSSATWPPPWLCPAFLLGSPGSAPRSQAPHGHRAPCRAGSAAGPALL